MPKLLAVIHHRDDGLALANAEVAFAAGCDGVMLIQMEGRDEMLDLPAVTLRNRYPEWFIGTNRLKMEPDAAIRLDASLGLDGTWVDNPGVSSAGAGARAGRIDAALAEVRRAKPAFLFFGSVAFKTQHEDPDPGAAARAASGRGWIATTSGPATGHAPSVDKLRVMKAALGDGQLAVASGISPENAAVLAPHVDWILAATGISSDFYTLDPERTGMLADAVRRETV